MRKLLLFVTILSSYTGCTLLGGAIGIALPQKETFSKADFLFSDYKGSTITINTKEKREIICQLDSVIIIEDSVYRNLYREYLQTNPQSDSLMGINKEYRLNGTRTFFTFTGFDFGGLRFDSLWAGHSSLLGFNEFEYLVDKSSKKFTKRYIRDLYDNLQLPLKSKLVVNLDNQKEVFDSVEITNITTSSLNPLITSVVLGMTLDLILSIGLTNTSLIGY